MADMISSGNGKGDSSVGSSVNGFSRESSQGVDHEDEKERTIAKAALSIAELVALLDGPVDFPASGYLDEKHGPPESQEQEEYLDTDITIPLRSINVVAARVPFIEDARTKVTTEMESMVLTGLNTLVRLSFRVCTC